MKGETAIAIVAVLLPQRGSVVTIELQSSGQKILILEAKETCQEEAESAIETNTTMKGETAIAIVVVLFPQWIDMEPKTE